MSSEELHENEALSEEDEVLSEEDEDLVSVFEKPNLVLKFGNKKIHVKKEQLMEQSVVFEKMFGSDFKEAKSNELQLPGKDHLTICRFLRCLLPGFDDELKEKTAHDILPLAKEYQTESLLKKIDTLLANEIKQKGDTISTDSIIQSILEADQYDMPQFRNRCIDVASRKMNKRLTTNNNFADIAQETKLKISIKRMSQIESVYENRRQKVNLDKSYYAKHYVIAVADLEPYMKIF